jgi:hypothetical protein
VSAQRALASPKGNAAEASVTASVVGPVKVWSSASGASSASVSGKRNASLSAFGIESSWVPGETMRQKAAPPAAARAAAAFWRSPGSPRGQHDGISRSARPAAEQHGHEVVVLGARRREDRGSRARQRRCPRVELERELLADVVWDGVGAVDAAVPRPARRSG